MALAALAFAAGCGSEGSGSIRSPSVPPELAAGWRTDFNRHTVPLNEFQPGGPGKDGIPALTRPRFLPVDRASFVRPREPVIELVADGEARAYPLQILVWHEIVNDRIAGVPVAVTFCPLCNTALVFDRRVDGRTLEFHVSGNLRNSDLVMFDRQTESWWQQFGGEGLVGRHAGEQLRQLPAQIVSFADFRRQHPAGLVLSRATGFGRPYGENPYRGYDDVGSPPIFPAANAGDKRLEPKERVVFVESGGESVAIPLSTLRSKKLVAVKVGGHRLVVRWRPGVASALDSGDIASGRDVGSVEVREDGRLVLFDEPFWFAVAAFAPDIRIVH